MCHSLKSSWENRLKIPTQRRDTLHPPTTVTGPPSASQISRGDPLIPAFGAADYASTEAAKRRFVVSSDSAHPTAIFI